MDNGSAFHRAPANLENWLRIADAGGHGSPVSTAGANWPESAAELDPRVTLWRVMTVKGWAEIRRLPASCTRVTL
jgi:hypothetical protein